MEACSRRGVTKFRKPRHVTLPEVIVDPDYAKVMALVKGEQ